MAFICHYRSWGCSGNVDVCPNTVCEDGFIWCSHGAAALVWCQCTKEQISTCCVSLSGITAALSIHSRFPGHTWARLAEPSDCMFNKKAVHSTLMHFHVFDKNLTLFEGRWNLSGILHPFLSLSYPLLMHWKSWFSFFQHAEGLCQERERERGTARKWCQLCSTRDLTIPSDLLIFGRRSADIKSKMLLLEKHGSAQTERVQHWGTVT